jgi:hypothetical protein
MRFPGAQSPTPPSPARRWVEGHRAELLAMWDEKDELPSVVAIACRALARDKHLLAAHYVPARKITRPAA